MLKSSRVLWSCYQELDRLDFVIYELTILTLPYFPIYVVHRVLQNEPWSGKARNYPVMCRANPVIPVMTIPLPDCVLRIKMEISVFWIPSFMTEILLLVKKHFIQCFHMGNHSASNFKSISKIQQLFFNVSLNIHVQKNGRNWSWDSANRNTISGLLMKAYIFSEWRIVALKNEVVGKI